MRTDLGLAHFLRPCSLGDLDAGTRFGLFTQAAAAVAHVHACGYVHRDVKSSNLMLDSTRTVAKLCDFGSAQPLMRVDLHPGSSTSAERCSSEASPSAPHSRAKAKRPPHLCEALARQCLPPPAASALDGPLPSGSGPGVVLAALSGATPWGTTAEYASPELCAVYAQQHWGDVSGALQAASHTVGAPSDVWALGLVGVELLRGAAVDPPSLDECQTYMEEELEGFLLCHDPEALPFGHGLHTLFAAMADLHDQEAVCTWALTQLVAALDSERLCSELTPRQRKVLLWVVSSCLMPAQEERLSARAVLDTSLALAIQLGVPRPNHQYAQS